MPLSTSLMARARTGLLRLFALAAVLSGSLMANAPEAQATTHPDFRSPFACGQSWFARTYAGHAQNAVDWNLPGSGEADYGQPVLAAALGVATVEVNSGYGNMVTVDHGGGWRSLYAHLSAVAVTTGQPVNADTVIGLVGKTGRSDGSHLHQEQSLNGVRQPVQADGAPIAAAYSSRASSYTSANCAAPVEAARAEPKSCQWATPAATAIRCGLTQRRPLP